MPNYIFDLDFTLYSKHDIDQSTNTKFYNSFRPNLFLIKLLTNLKGNKFIFSNGNKSHVEFIIDKMRLKNIFKKIISRDNYNGKLKPDIQPYKYAIETFSISDNTKTYFFEDTLENLETAKKIGWKTVFINNDGLSDLEIQKHNFIDYKFSCVEQALLFFINSKS